MTRNCKTCSKPIKASETAYDCVGCGDQFHLESVCLGMSNVAINGIKELGRRAMLLCNLCVEKNERDKFIRSRTFNVMEEKLENFAQSLKKVEELETKLEQIVETKIEDSVTKSCTKIETCYAQVAAKNVPKSSINPTGAKPAPPGLDHDIARSFRIQGIPEDPTKSRDENFVRLNDEVNSTLQSLGMTPGVTSIKRLGKFDKDRTKGRTVMVSVQNPHEVELIIAKSYENRQMLSSRNIYILQALSKEDSMKENLCLKKRRELLNQGVDRGKLRIRNFELFNNNVKVELSSEEPSASSEQVAST